jgi:hypothetical protein
MLQIIPGNEIVSCSLKESDRLRTMMMMMIPGVGSCQMPKIHEQLQKFLKQWPKTTKQP